MYADSVTPSMERAIRRRTGRDIQMAYNEEHGIVPTTIHKGVRDIIEISKKDKTGGLEGRRPDEEGAGRTDCSAAERDEGGAAKLLEFEHAAYLRDRIKAAGKKQVERKEVGPFCQRKSLKFRVPESTI